MAEQLLKDRIFDLLKSDVFSDPRDFVDVSDGPIGDIHVVVVSRKLDERRGKERDEMIWSALSGSLNAEELEQISLTVGVSPEQVKSVY